jgi:arsenite methyltransferase
MTPEMISKARLNAAKGRHLNVEFRLGEIEHLPVANNIADVIISNCVLNLSTNKPQVLKEAARVLKVRGRLAISDIVATSPLPQEIKNDLALHSGCMAGATPLQELEECLRDAGFIDISIVVNKASRNFIEKWSYAQSGVENFVASATIRAIKS